MRTSDIREAIDLTEATLDAGAHTVKNARIITAGWSKNARAYPEHVLEASVKLWDGVKAYADHPSKLERRNRPERSIRDVVGVYESPRYRDGVVYSDLRVLGEAKTWLWPFIEETVTSGKPIIGLSINALGKTVKGKHEGRKGIVVEAITHANSVDVVTTPAAGGGFQDSELMMSDDGWTGAVLESLNLDELREARPDLLESLKKEWKTPRNDAALLEAQNQTKQYQRTAKDAEDKLRTAQSQLQEATDKIAGLKRGQAVDRIIQASKLPPQWKEALAEELSQSPPDRWDAILEREQRKAAVIPPRRAKVTGAGGLKEAAPQPTTTRQERLTIFGDAAVGLNESYGQYIKRTQKEKQ